MHYEILTRYKRQWLQKIISKHACILTLSPLYIQTQLYSPVWTGNDITKLIHDSPFKCIPLTHIHIQREKYNLVKFISTMASVGSRKANLELTQLLKISHCLRVWIFDLSFSENYGRCSIICDVWHPARWSLFVTWRRASEVVWDRIPSSAVWNKLVERGKAHGILLMDSNSKPFSWMAPGDFFKIYFIYELWWNNFICCIHTDLEKEIWEEHYLYRLWTHWICKVLWVVWAF